MPHGYCLSTVLHNVRLVHAAYTPVVAGLPFARYHYATHAGCRVTPPPPRTTTGWILIPVRPHTLFAVTYRSGFCGYHTRVAHRTRLRFCHGLPFYHVLRLVLYGSLYLHGCLRRTVLVVYVPHAHTRCVCPAFTCVWFTLYTPPYIAVTVTLLYPLGSCRILLRGYATILLRVYWFTLRTVVTTLRLTVTFYSSTVRFGYTRLFGLDYRTHHPAALLHTFTYVLPGLPPLHTCSVYAPFSFCGWLYALPLHCPPHTFCLHTCLPYLPALPRTHYGFTAVLAAVYFAFTFALRLRSGSGWFFAHGSLHGSAPRHYTVCRLVTRLRCLCIPVCGCAHTRFPHFAPFTLRTRALVCCCYRAVLVAAVCRILRSPVAVVTARIPRFALPFYVLVVTHHLYLVVLRPHTFMVHCRTLGLRFYTPTLPLPARFPVTACGCLRYVLQFYHTPHTHTFAVAITFTLPLRLHTVHLRVRCRLVGFWLVDSRYRFYYTTLLGCGYILPLRCGSHTRLLFTRSHCRTRWFTCLRLHTHVAVLAVGYARFVRLPPDYRSHTRSRFCRFVHLPFRLFPVVHTLPGYAVYPTFPHCYHVAVAFAVAVTFTLHLPPHGCGFGYVYHRTVTGCCGCCWLVVTHVYAVTLVVAVVGCSHLVYVLRTLLHAIRRGCTTRIAVTTPDYYTRYLPVHLCYAYRLSHYLPGWILHRSYAYALHYPLIYLLFPVYITRTLRFTTHV